MPSFSRFIEPATNSEKWNGKPRMACVNVRHPSSNNPVGVLPWTCRSQRKWQSRQTVGHNNHHRRVASRKILSVEELETLPAGTKPRTSHHRSPGGEREGRREEALNDLHRELNTPHAWPEGRPGASDGPTPSPHVWNPRAVI